MHLWGRNSRFLGKTFHLWSRKSHRWVNSLHHWCRNSHLLLKVSVLDSKLQPFPYKIPIMKKIFQYFQFFTPTSPFLIRINPSIYTRSQTPFTYIKKWTLFVPVCCRCLCEKEVKCKSLNFTTHTLSFHWL